MGKFILFIFAIFFFFLNSSQASFAASSDRLLVSPVNIPTMQSSYGVYPNTLDMIANDIINSLNKNAGYTVPDLNTANDLIESYGLSKDYKEFLMNYRDNRVVDYKTCNLLANRLGVNQILLVSGGFDLQNMVLDRPEINKFEKIPFFTLPLYFTKFLTSGVLLAQIPYLGSHVYNDLSNQDPIRSYYRVNILLTLIDADSGIVVWEKDYKDKINSSYFETPVNSFGENPLSSEKLRELSQKISKETAASLSGRSTPSEFATVQSSIVSNPKKKFISTDGKKTMEGQPSYSNNVKINNNYENKRKESFKNWVKQQTAK